MDWSLAVEHNRQALLRLLAGLFALVGPEKLPRHLRNHVLSVLRPAESAARRLVVIVAQHVALDPSFFTLPHKPASQAATSGRTSSATPGFAIFDPLIDPLVRRPKRARSIPRIGFGDRPVIVAPSPDDLVDATRLGQRLDALKAALDDPDPYARRVARWKARLDRDLLAEGMLLRNPSPEIVAAAAALEMQPKRPKAPPGRAPRRRMVAIRHARPPGRRKRRTREIDDILRECHTLALYALDATYR